MKEKNLKALSKLEMLKMLRGQEAEIENLRAEKGNVTDKINQEMMD